MTNSAAMRVIADIAEERARQLVQEGWSVSHDDQHEAGELAFAAAAYTVNAANPHTQIATAVAGWGKQLRGGVATLQSLLWPWGPEWWKPKDRRRDLIRAAALIVAEIERLDRLSLKQESATP